MENLQGYYDEHAQQARQHEDQRERVANIIHSIAGVLVGLITFAELSFGSLPASLTPWAPSAFSSLANSMSASISYRNHEAHQKGNG